MYICDECHEDQQHSKYHVPAILHSKNRNRILHLECCSRENLVNRINEIIESEIMFYEDVSKLVENFNSETLEKFKKKYGTYEEIIGSMKYDPMQDAMLASQIDKFLEILAVINELEKHL
ncbi:hypothetical protein [Candidatus Nitrosotenuis cloacae]|uniref:Uncharacterized protein n=1 Tax=Candidatus Nitrosotenuis cloacae TaxID=1603555 RepID=A0A3G1B2W9_9ARCH|nr:hypothetical protein [Candidatus Nitrosotenuis cloacae]AJZ76213.1 hypothetical protein SU86_007370 [Candidatus Nitrosotenuis cloacae]